MYKMLNESNQHNSKARLAQSEATRILNLFKNELVNQEYTRCWKEYRQDCKRNGIELTYDREDRYRIQNNKLLQILFVFAYKSTKKGSSMPIMNSLENIQVFQQNRGLEKHKISQLGFYIGFPKNNKAEGEHYEIRKGVSEINLTFPKFRIPKEMNLIDYCNDILYIKKMQNILNDAVATLAHELSHLWDSSKERSKTQQYKGYDTTTNWSCALFPFLTERFLYITEAQELDAFCQGAYTQWKRSGKEKRKSFFDCVAFQLSKCTFKRFAENIESYATDANNKWFINEFVLAVYVMYVYLPQKNVFKYAIQLDKRKEQYNDIKEKYGDFIEDIKHGVENVILVIQKLMKKYPETSLQKAVSKQYRTKNALQTKVADYENYLNTVRQSYKTNQNFFFSYVASDDFVDDVVDYLL